MFRLITMRHAAAGALLLTITALIGCGGPVLGLVATAVVPEYKQVKVTADYRGLDNQVVAVMVNLNEYAYAQYPQALKDMSWALAKELRANVPGISLVNPDDVVAFQDANPYWNTLRYSQLISRMKVDRIVLVDVLQYSMHEPGNKHILQGLIVGDVKVIEAPRSDAGEHTSRDALAYSKTVEARYPKDNPIGIIDGDQRSVEVATLKEFSRTAGQLFYDHQELRPNR